MLLKISKKKLGKQDKFIKPECSRESLWNQDLTIPPAEDFWGEMGNIMRGIFYFISFSVPQ